MSEQTIRITPPEVTAVRAWMEEEVIARNICPPLVKLTQAHRENGHVKWDDVTREVDIISFAQMRHDDPALLQRSVNAYYDFIANAVAGDPTLTRVFVLPDFPSNQHYIDFMQSLKGGLFTRLIASEAGKSVASEALRQGAEAKGVELNGQDGISQLLQTGPVSVGMYVIETVMPPIHFFGRRMSDTDTANFGDAKEPIQREKVISRAPHFLLQLINPMASREVIGNLDQHRLIRRNTQLALATDLNVHEQRINQMRRRLRAR